MFRTFCQGSSTHKRPLCIPPFFALLTVLRVAQSTVVHNHPRLFLRPLVLPSLQWAVGLVWGSTTACCRLPADGAEHGLALGLRRAVPVVVDLCLLRGKYVVSSLNQYGPEGNIPEEIECPPALSCSPQKMVLSGCSSFDFSNLDTGRPSRRQRSDLFRNSSNLTSAITRHQVQRLIVQYTTVYPDSEATVRKIEDACSSPGVCGC